MADIFDALADGTRRELLSTLSACRWLGTTGGELTVSQLVERLGVSQPTVSKHLQRLKEHGLVSVRTNGQHHLYRLEPEALHAVGEWIGALAAGAPDDSAAVHPWPGTEVGGSIGRTIADRTHGARTAVTGATEKVSQKLPNIGRRKGES